MSHHHVARCEGPRCKTEAPLKETFSHQQMTYSGSGPSPVVPATYSTPEKWLTAERREFCSWACLAAFAAKMEVPA